MSLNSNDLAHFHFERGEFIDIVFYNIILIIPTFDIDFKFYNSYILITNSNVLNMRL